MILCIIEPQRISEIYLEAQRQDFKVLREAAYMIQQKGSWSLRLPYNLFRLPNEQSDGQYHTRVHHRFRDETADLFLIGASEGWKQFERFSVPDDLFTIGSSPDDDIRLQRGMYEPSAYVIDPDSHLIVSNCSLPVFLNGKSKGRKTNYMPGDLLEYFGFRMILHDEFLMIGKGIQTVHQFAPYQTRAQKDPPAHTVFHAGRIDQCKTRRPGFHCGQTERKSSAVNRTVFDDVGSFAQQRPDQFLQRL